jgi:hypothetical protein
MLGNSCIYLVHVKARAVLSKGIAAYTSSHQKWSCDKSGNGCVKLALIKAGAMLIKAIVALN